MEAYRRKLSIRKVDERADAVGISKSEVSRICAELDPDVTAFNTQYVGEQGFVYVFLDATFASKRTHSRGPGIAYWSRPGPEQVRRGRDDDRFNASEVLSDPWAPASAVLSRTLQAVAGGRWMCSLPREE